MPELPDITIYIEALESRVVGQTLERVLLKNPFLLRTVEPALADCEGRKVVELRRLGKRIVIGLEGDIWLVFHLMIAGRLHWYAKRDQSRIRAPLLRLEFGNGLLTLTEAGKKRRASLHILGSTAELQDYDRGGLEVLDCDLSTFQHRLTQRNHTLKRALTDPSIFSGIGNAYSDEILHQARLSPLLQTRLLTDEHINRLFIATRDTLQSWIHRLRDEYAGEFPEKVTAFRKGMAVHGCYGKPCPVCDTAIQRIRYAENETSYCPRCQTNGKVLADRSLSRLLKDDWPRTIDALEQLKKSKTH